jgi:ribose 5-phosphate isomerase
MADDGNHIVDCAIAEIPDPTVLKTRLEVLDGPRDA